MFSNFRSATLALSIAAAFSGCQTSPQAKEAKFLKRGEALAAKKDYSKAILEFRNAAAAMPKDAEPPYQIGLAYLASGDSVNAARAFHQATELNPKHLQAQLKLAELMTVSRYPQYLQEAASRLENAFGDSPANPEVADTLAVAEFKLGKSHDAVQRLEQALERFPDHLKSSLDLAQMKIYAKDWEGAERVLKQAVAGSPQLPQAAVALGEFYNFRGRPDDAQGEFEKALELDPQNGPALLGLAAIQIAAKRMDDAERTYQRIATLPGASYRPMHAIFLYQTGKPSAAISELEKLAKADPADRSIRSLLVAAYLGAGRQPEAAKTLDDALRRNPKDSDALLQRGELRLKWSKPQDAEKDFSEALHFRPDSAPLHFALAQAYAAESRTGVEQEEFHRALELSPHFLQARLSLEASYLSARQGKAALGVMDSAPDDQKNSAAWLIGRNWALISAGDLKAARAGIDQALHAGRPADAVYQDGALRFLQRDPAGARTDMEELLERDASDTKAVELMMSAYEESGELSKGVARLTRLVEAHPESAPLLQLLGVAYAHSGDSAAARKTFERAKAADPRLAAPELALAEMDIQEGRAQDAQAALSSILATDPRNTRALLLKAGAADSSGDRTGAEAAYRAALDVEPSNLVALNNLAYDLAIDNPDEALKLAQQASELAPGSANIDDTLGRIYYRKGLYSMSVEYLKTAVAADPTPRRQFHLAMSYLKSGDRATGLPILTKALQKQPTLAKTETDW